MVFPLLIGCFLLSDDDLSVRLGGSLDSTASPDSAANDTGAPSECDADGDGAESAACGGSDCDDADATLHPGADDVDCDGLDQDCDGLPDGPLAVPGAQPSIQAAIDASVDGDTICVAAGTYLEAIDFGAHSVSVVGAGSGTTRIDGGGSRTVTIYNPAISATLRGFTITGGEGNFGGGMYAESAATTLQDLVIEGNICTLASGCLGTGLYLTGPADLTDVVIRDNYAAPAAADEVYVYGAGAYVYLSTGTWERVTLTDNTADVSLGRSYGYVLGAGLTLGGSSLTLSEITITNNLGTRSGGGLLQGVGWGGGLLMDYDASNWDGLVLADNGFSFPAAVDTVGGAGMYVGHSTTAFSHAAIVGNDSSAGTVYGGGMYVLDGADLNFSNSTVAGNRSTGQGGAFGTIRVDSGGIARFTNVDIVGNTVEAGTYAYGGAFHCEGTGEIQAHNTNVVSNVLTALYPSGGAVYATADTATANFEYSSIFGNSEPEFGGVGSSVGYFGNIAVDPLYASVTGADPLVWDLALMSGSGAIDAGNPAAAYNDTDGTRNDLGGFGGPAGAW